MANFGLDWMDLTDVSEPMLFDFEKLLYYHQIPFESVKKMDGYLIRVPEKYLAISKEIVKDYRAGILLEPVNGFEPRYSTFERGTKIRRVAQQKRRARGNFLFLLVIMMIMLALQMLMYLRQ